MLLLLPRSALLRLFFTSNFKKDNKDLAPPEFPPPPGCVGLATALSCLSVII